jgi:hypothetical protein
MNRGRPLKPAREEAMRVICWLLALALAAAAPLAGYADVTPLRIAFLSDMSGPNADLSGVGSVEAGIWPSRISAGGSWAGRSRSYATGFILANGGKVLGSVQHETFTW